MHIFSVIFFALLFPVVLRFFAIIAYIKKAGQLLKLASLQHECDRTPAPFRTKLSIYYTCMCLIMHHIYISFFQMLNRSVVKLNKNTYELTYMLNNNMYKIIIKTAIGPQPKIIQALNEVDSDITDIIVPYLGPAGNFHGLKYKPTDFNFKVLTLNMSDTRELSFSANDEININREPKTHISSV